MWDSLYLLFHFFCKLKMALKITLLIKKKTQTKNQTAKP